MELKLNTVDLQSMVSKAIKGASNNKLIPITSLMNIKVANNILTLTTTDATNYFYVSSDKGVLCDDFELSVMADLFTRLVQKTTSENITLVIDGNILKVKGNGTYTMELPLDENGNIIKFPVKELTEYSNPTNIKLTTVKTILNFNKPSLALSVEYPSLTAYYCGNKIVTSDRVKICSTDIDMFEEPMLISSSLMELLGVMTEEDIKVYRTADAVEFDTKTERIYSSIMEGIDTYPIQAITSLVEQPFPSSCKISRQAVLSVLDRLSLFVSPYDNRGIYLTFTKEGVTFSSKKSSGTELIPYIASENFSEYTCCIDIEMLRSQIATQDDDNISLSYGTDNSIKMVTKNITQIVALSVDDRVEG